MQSSYVFLVHSLHIAPYGNRDLPAVCRHVQGSSAASVLVDADQWRPDDGDALVIMQARI